MWYNKTEIATKADLDKVKGMIDVSARLVHTVTVNGIRSLPITISYDYCVIKSIFYNTMGTNSNSSTDSRIFTSELTTINLGGSAYLNALIENSSSGYSQIHNIVQVSASASTITFSSNVYSVTVEYYKYQ